MIFFPCYLNRSISSISKHSSYLGICPAPLGTEAHMAYLEMTGGAKMALMMPAVLEAKLDFGVIYQSWRPPHVTVVILVILMVTVCHTFLC